nr:MAG TPA: hypothetical protein [Bacteriophage sp.]
MVFFMVFVLRFGLVFFAFVVCIMPQKHIYSKSIRGHICTKHEG